MDTTLRLFDGYQDTSPALQPAVRHLQIALNERGYPTSVDGYFGPITEESVRRFQSGNGIKADGVVGPRTWSMISGIGIESMLYETNYLVSDASLLAQNKVAGKWRKAFEMAGKDAGVRPSLIVAICSRESMIGLSISGPAGTGDRVRRATMKPWRTGNLPPDGGGFGRGLMQIDYDAHEFARGRSWQDPVQNIAYGGGVLRDDRMYIGRNFPDLSESIKLRASLAAYNCGAGRVRDAINAERDIDYYTSGRDYSRDVLARAGWFQLHGWA